MQFDHIISNNITYLRYLRYIRRFIKGMSRFRPFVSVRDTHEDVLLSCCELSRGVNRYLVPGKSTICKHDLGLERRQENYDGDTGI